MRELHPSLNAETLSIQRVKLIVNLNDLGFMGIMFLARAAQAKAIWRLDCVWPHAGKSGGSASQQLRRWSTNSWKRSKMARCGASWRDGKSMS
jgi:hypothetical protein